MYREFDYINLGGTMYTPATSKNILDIANGEKFDFLKSVVFCLEDAIKDTDVEFAMKNIKNLLQNYKRANIKVFIRPRDINNLKEILKLKDIEKIDGFALAKISFKNMQDYFMVLNDLEQKYHIMPVLESSDIFQNTALKYIRDFLLNHKKHNIVTIRFGGEDMFKMIGLKKSCSDSIHHFHISSKVFADMLSIFKPSGLNITAPVYNCLENYDIFENEVKRDIKEGFFGKTVIHPNQAKIVNDVYKVSQKELDEAKEILNIQNDAIFRFEDKMCEPSAHNSWATNIIKRYETYGVN
jgi:citrate lyase beta subunit